MKKMHQLLAVLGWFCCFSQVMWADINFGSDDSCIMIIQGTLDVGAAQLSGGLIRDVSSAGGVVAEGAVWARMTLEINNPAYSDGADATVLKLNGAITLDGESPGSIVLANDECLTVSGAVFAAIYMNGSYDFPSKLRGAGSVTQGITINDQGAGIVSWSGPLDNNIGLNASMAGNSAYLKLGSDLAFRPFSMVTALDSGGGTNRVEFEGYKMFLGGDESDPTIIYNSHEWQDANVQLTGPVLLETGKQLIIRHDGYINGGGNSWIFNDNSSIDLDDYTTTLTNIVLERCQGNFLQNGAIACEDVTFEYSGGESFVVRTGQLSGPYINPFEGDMRIRDAQIMFKSDTVIEGTWTISENTYMDGDGCHLDLYDGTLQIDANVDLSLRNIVLDYVSSSSLTGSGTLKLANVTIIVDLSSPQAVVDWTSGPTIVIEGPVTFVTGLKMISVAEGSIIDEVTAYYDTLGDTDQINVTGFEGTGRLQWVDAVTNVTYGSFSVFGSSRLSRSLYLYPELSGTTPCTILFERAGGGSIQYDGRGRTLFFPRTNPAVLSMGESEAVLFIDGGTAVYFTNMTIDGFKTQHVELDNADVDSLVFGNSTLVILREDLSGDAALDQPLYFGKATSSDQTMILNLNGHSIDCAHDNAAIVLQGSDDSVLRIQNGRLLNVSANKLRSSSGNTIIFESVDIHIVDDAVLEGGSVRIEGCSSVYGIGGKKFTYEPDDFDSFTIESNATFTVQDGLTYEHASSATNNFVFDSGTSQLVLMGGTFMRTDVDGGEQLLFTTGHLLIDHTSYLNAGHGGIALGNGESSDANFTIDFRPGATLTLLGGQITYNNVE
jgi:hypothetical protein